MNNPPPLPKKTWQITSFKKYKENAVGIYRDVKCLKQQERLWGRADIWDGTAKKGKNSTWRAMVGTISGWKPV